MAKNSDQVQEMQGLYGPFTIAERVVQKIWLRRDFALDQATLTDGTSLRIRFPGTWNLLGGPDFLGAKLEMAGREITGDIEVHFHVLDWRAHGHASDPAYDNVVLHVVMFPPDAGQTAVRRDGGEIPTLVLLPLLHRSLEEYASDDALENITARDSAERIAELLAMPKDNVVKLLQVHAARRWALKVHFATLRIKQLGWIGASHHTALEILGYRHNRAAMLTLATRHPLAEWTGEVDIEAFFHERKEQWQIQGVRPANQPRLRLRQYQAWVRHLPDWPAALLKIGPEIPASLAAPTVQFRKQMKLTRFREQISQKVVGAAIGGSRLDTLICDGFLPSLAAATGRDLFPVWFHWYLGDIPVEVRKSLKMAGISGRVDMPHCHGWGQGLLGWMHRRDARASG